MRILSCDFTGDDDAHSIADLLTAAGYTLLDSEAFVLIFSLATAGQAGSRVGGPDVAANRGIPITSAPLVLGAVSGRVGTSPSMMWSLVDTFLWAQAGSVVSVCAWCR